MANEYKLSYTAEQIDERLTKAGNAILHEKQDLPEEKKARARANMGAVSEDDVKVIVDAAVNAIVRSLADLKSAIANGRKNISLGADFEIGEQVALPSGTCLNGCGHTITRSTGYELALFTLRANCKIHNITINGNRENMVSPLWNTTREIATSERCVVEDVTIENGNEAITVYGDDVVVRNCKITDCGGNGIHFSGANRSRVENCVVINSNLKTGMGHEDGGIIWSNNCCDTVALNNYVENAKCAFGSIDSENNSDIKIIGNTAKNCLEAVEGTFQSSIPKNLIISNNQFVNCVRVSLSRTDGGATSEVNWIISNNLFDNTKFALTRVAHCIIQGNTFKNAPSYNEIGYCQHISLFGNNFSGIDSPVSIYVHYNRFVIIEGNVMTFSTDADTDNRIINAESTNTGLVIRGNIIEVNAEKCTGRAISAGKRGAIVEGNRISIKSGIGIVASSNGTFCNNVIACGTAEQHAILAYGGTVNCLVANNLSNGVFKINSTDVTTANNISCDALEYATE